MITRKTVLLDQPLSMLIRTYSENVLPDIIALTDHILTSERNQLDRPGHKFSTNLFVAAVSYTLNEFGDAACLEHVMQCLVNIQKFGTEKKMLDCIATSTRHSLQYKAINQFLKEFAGAIAPLSTGAAKRLVQASFLQWRKALDMPELSDREKTLYGFTVPVKTDAPSLSNIRIGTRYELSDATALATATLKPARSQTDRTTYDFAHSLFIAACLCVAHMERNPNMAGVLNFAVDPSWDDAKQIFSYVVSSSLFDGQPKTKKWAETFSKTSCAIPDGVATSLVKRSYALWKQALTITGKSVQTEVPAAIAEPPNSVQIFKPSVLAAAATLVGEMREDRRGGPERLLKSAQENDGFRLVPDPKKAHIMLEKAKGKFENLIDPINHLQKSLILSAAMSPKNFRVRPVLLLGEPGIGKTFLAMALANGLGGSMEKLSAGGAQGGFQLNGSHSSWHTSKYGQVFKALAEGKTTSPVFVIDEIDKMGADDRYPILPVLLDLFEPGTATIFKDEFFEIDFDASRIIFILTANDIGSVSEPLRSRVEIFYVPRPEPEQRMRIIKEEFKQLCAATSKQIRLDKSTSQKLADRKDIDLRRTTSMVRDSFADAIIAGEKIAKIIIPNDGQRSRGGSNGAYTGNRMGFI